MAKSTKGEFQPVQGAYLQFRAYSPRFKVKWNPWIKDLDPTTFKPKYPTLEALYLQRVLEGSWQTQFGFRPQAKDQEDTRICEL